MLKIEFTNNALKFLDKCDNILRNRLLNEINNLSAKPSPKSVVKLKDCKGLFRVRVGKYRILYDVDKEKVLIHKIDKRERVYD